VPASVHAQQRPRLGTRGPLTFSDLSRELELGHSTVSGIVQRQPSPTDRRYTRVSLTDELSHTARP
jgi:DNA-binding MarR family transcriptional regulator